MARNSAAKYPWGRDAPASRYRDQVEKLSRLETELRDSVSTAVVAALDAIGVSAGKLTVEGGALGRIVEAARRAAEADGYQRYEPELNLARRMAAFVRRAEALGLDVEMLDLADREVRSRFDRFVEELIVVGRERRDGRAGVVEEPGNVGSIEGGAEDKKIPVGDGAADRQTRAAEQETGHAPATKSGMSGATDVARSGESMPPAAAVERPWPADLPPDPAVHGTYPMQRADTKQPIYVLTSYLQGCPHPWRARSTVAAAEYQKIIDGQRRMILECYGGKVPPRWTTSRGFKVIDGLLVEDPDVR